MTKLKGATVPNQGFVEKVYINTELSVDEIKTIFGSINGWMPAENDTLMYIVVGDTTLSTGIVLHKSVDGTMLGITGSVNGVPIAIFDSANGGWQEFENPIIIENAVVDTIEGMPIGTENELLKSLIFVPVKQVLDLNEFLTDIANAIRIKKDVQPIEKWVGTEVPNNGTIDSVYVNTSLSTFEVDNILKDLTYVSLPIGNEGETFYAIASDNLMSNGMTIVKLSIGYRILYGSLNNATLIYDSTGEVFNGWSTFTNPIALNMECVSSIPNPTNPSELILTGAENNKLIPLVSTTQYKKVEEMPKINAQDFESEILSISGNACQIVQPEIIDTTVAVPNTGTTQKIWFNSNLTEEEIIDIIDNANLPYKIDGIRKVYYIMEGVDFTFTIEDYSTPENPNAFMIMVLSFIPLFASKNMLNVENGINIRAYGWATDVAEQTNNFKFTFNEPVNLFDRGSGTDSADWMKEWHGTKNDKLKRLVYSDGAIYETGNMEVVKELSGQYLAETQTVTPEKTTTYNILDLIGEKVENKTIGNLLISDENTNVQGIYFNTSLTPTEVADILSKLLYKSDPNILDGTPFYIAYANPNLSRCIAIVGMAGMYMIADGNFFTMEMTEIFVHSPSEGISTWTIADKYFSMNNEVGVNYIEQLQINVGDQNDKLTSLMSMNTDFELKEIKTKVFPKNVKVDINELVKPSGTIDITENDSYDVSQYAIANVNVTPNLQEKAVTPTDNEQNIVYDSGYDGLSRVTVNSIPEEYIVPNGTLEITSNGEQDVTTYASVNVNVDVKPNLTDVSIRPQKQTVIRRARADGYDGYDVVYVFPPSYTEKTVTPTTETQIIESIYDDVFLRKVTVNPVTASIDSNIQSGNIKEGVTILGVTGNLGNNLTLQEKTVTPSDLIQEVISDSGYDGLSKVTVRPIEGYVKYNDYYNLLNRTITEFEMPYEVYNVYNYSFVGCKQLRSFNFTRSINSIGEHAFESCSSLTSITLPETISQIGNYAFSGCSNLESINIQDTVISKIAEKTFYNCQNLNNITIPETVSQIEPNAFEQCSSLTNITIPNSVTSIGQQAFKSCSALEQITLPENLTEISSGLFYLCRKLSSITIGENIQYIRPEAFMECSSLTEVIIPNNVIFIGSSSFGQCRSLQKITIPFVGQGKTSSYNWFGYIFGDSYDKKGNNVPSSLTEVVVTGGTLQRDAFASCEKIKSISIPQDTKEIPSTCFYYCEALENFVIPQGVTSIGSQAFYNCESMTSVTIPNSVTTIGGNAFSGCSSLTNVTIPSSVTTIDYHAFLIGSATNKATITMLSTTPPTIANSTFNKNYLSQLIVPVGCGETYKAATNWSALADIIVEASE